MSDYKPVLADYEFVAAQDGENEQAYYLTQQEVAVLLAFVGVGHWPTRWTLRSPTQDEIDFEDAVTAGAEGGLVTPVDVVDGLSPFWDDPDAEDADGEPADNTYSYTERIEDWAIAAFVAASGVPGAAALYLTIAPRFRLAFKTRDWGGIAKIFIDDVQVATVDTYSPTPGLITQDIIVPT